MNNSYKFRRYHSYTLENISLMISIVSGLTLFVMSIIIIGQYASISGNVAANKELYKSLIYKAETENIRDDFGIVNKEYLDEVQSWNVDLARNKQYQKDFWIGIFYPNVFDQFEFIDLDNIKFKVE